MALIWKKGYFDLLFTFFSYQGKVIRIPSAHSHSHTYMYFAHPIDFFALPILEKNNKNKTKKKNKTKQNKTKQNKTKQNKTNLSGMVSLWCDSWCWFLFAPFWNNQWITKWWAKFKLECLLLMCSYTNAKFIVLCELRTQWQRWRLSSIQKLQKALLLNSSLLLFIGKKLL